MSAGSRSVLAALALLAPTAAPAQAEDAAAPEPAWRLAVSSLVNGRFARLGCREEGAPALETVAAQLAQAPGALAVDAGDLLGASATARLALERDAAALARALLHTGLRGAALGHRDLSAEPQVLRRFLAALRAQGLQHVASNLECSAAASSLCEVLVDASDPPLLLDSPGGPTALLGFLAPELLSRVAPDRREGLTLQGLEEAIPREVARATAAGARHAVLVLDPAPGSELASTVAAAGWARLVDAVVARGLPPAVVALEMAQDSAPVVAARPGEVVLFEPGAPARALAEGPPPAEVASYAGELGDWLCREQVRPLRGAALAEPMTRAAFAGLLLDTLRAATGADVAAINQKAVRGRFPLQGALTRFDAVAALPFEDSLATTRLRGAALSAFATAPRFADFFVRGLSVKDGKVEVNGRPLEPDQWYAVATTGYVASLGGEGLGAGAVFAVETSASPLETLLAWLDLERPGGRLSWPSDPAEHARWSLRVTIDGAASDVRISNPLPAVYNDAQLARSESSSLALDARLFAGADHPALSFQNLLRVEYALGRTVADGRDSGLVETRDLVSARSALAWRVFRPTRRWYHPLPDVEAFVETEFDRPGDGTRDYHHLLLRPTVGVRFDLSPRLYLRVGAGLDAEVFAPASPLKGVALARLELNPGRLLSLGERSLDGRALLEAAFGDPWRHLDAQVRASVQVSLPLWRWLSMTLGYDVYVRAWERQRVALSGDLAAGLKVSLDHAIQDF